MLSSTVVKGQIILATALALEPLGQLIGVLRHRQFYVLRSFLFRGRRCHDASALIKNTIHI